MIYIKGLIVHLCFLLCFIVPLHAMKRSAQRPPTTDKVILYGKFKSMIGDQKRSDAAIIKMFKECEKHANAQYIFNMTYGSDKNCLQFALNHNKLQLFALLLQSKYVPIYHTDAHNRHFLYDVILYSARSTATVSRLFRAIDERFATDPDGINRLILHKDINNQEPIVFALQYGKESHCCRIMRLAGFNKLMTTMNQAILNHRQTIVESFMNQAPTLSPDDFNERIKIHVKYNIVYTTQEIDNLVSICLTPTDEDQEYVRAEKLLKAFPAIYSSHQEDSQQNILHQLTRSNVSIKFFDYVCNLMTADFLATCFNQGDAQGYIPLAYAQNNLYNHLTESYSSFLKREDSDLAPQILDPVILFDQQENNSETSPIFFDFTYPLDPLFDDTEQLLLPWYPQENDVNKYVYAHPFPAPF